MINLEVYIIKIYKQVKVLACFLVQACESSGLYMLGILMSSCPPNLWRLVTLTFSYILSFFLLLNWSFSDLQIHTYFSFASGDDFLKNDIRVKPDLDGLGSLGDTGWYCIRAILWAADYELPKTVTALPGPVLNEAGVILSCGASLHWEDGKVATLHCSFLESLTMDITATGTKGTLHVHDFVIPFQENEASFSTGAKCFFNDLVTGWTPLPSEHTVITDLPQEVRMVREFSCLVGDIKNGAKPESKWPIISRKTQIILDAVKTSIEKDLTPVTVEW